MRYFSEDELKCSCCGNSGMDADFMALIERLREQADFPFVVTSAYRCPKHPIEAGKPNPGTGAHCTGKAIDIKVSRQRAFMLLDLAISAGIKRIGVSQKGDGRFLHLDTCDDKLSPTIWSY